MRTERNLLSGTASVLRSAACNGQAEMVRVLVDGNGDAVWYAETYLKDKEFTDLLLEE